MADLKSISFTESSSSGALRISGGGSVEALVGGGASVDTIWGVIVLMVAPSECEKDKEPIVIEF